MTIKKILRLFILKHKRNNKSFIKYLNQIGANVSTLAYFPAPNKVTIDETRPYLIEIGDYVTITEGCTILTHGFDWSVLKVKYGVVIGSSGKVTIKNNVFIGMNSIILKGVTIGENSIIGAGSVVTRDIPSNVVAAGNPCRVICNIEEYYNKRLEKESEEAKELIRVYFNKFGKFPNNSEMAEFMWLFSDDYDLTNTSINNKLKYGGNYDFSYNLFKNSNKKYNNLKELCEDAIKNIN